MAEEELTTLDDGEAEGEAESSPKKSSPMKTYGIYGAIVIVMIAAAYFVTLKVVKPMFAGSPTATGEVVETEEAQTVEEEEGSDAHGSSDTPAGNMFMISDIIVNPAGTGGTRFLSTSIGFEVEKSSASGRLTEKEAIIRDALITILSSQSIPELSDFRQRDRLRLVIERRVEKILKSEDIAAVYFTEFVLQ